MKCPKCGFDVFAHGERCPKYPYDDDPMPFPMREVKRGPRYTGKQGKITVIKKENK